MSTEKHNGVLVWSQKKNTIFIDNYQTIAINDLQIHFLLSNETTLHMEDEVKIQYWFGVVRCDTVEEAVINQAIYRCWKIMQFSIISDRKVLHNYHKSKIKLISSVEKQYFVDSIDFLVELECQESD